MHILVIDDFALARLMMISALKRLNITNVLQAASLSEASTMLASSKVKIDIILCNSSTPGVEGLEFIRRLRNQSKWKSMPVILFDTEAERVALEQSQGHAPTEDLIKRLTLPSLEDRLREIIHDLKDRKAKAS